MIDNDYGTSGGINDSLSRVNGLIDGGTTTLVNYSYLGLKQPVQTTYPEPSIQYTLLGSAGGNNPTTGDIYWGLDLFGRIVDSRWFNTGTSADVDRLYYGYDRDSNRIWRQNPVATSAGAAFDEFYNLDGLQRLKDMQRGTLNGGYTGITSPTFGQCWTLDPTSNWRGFNEAASGSAWTTVQSRTANTVNEIANVTATTGSSWATPAYDQAGNMTSIPEPANLGTNYTATYDAWNRLVQLVDAGSGNTVQQNQFDARTYRTIVNSYTSGVLSETRHCYYTKEWQHVEERVGSATTMDRQFVWGHRHSDDLILRDRNSERFYSFQDANGNVTSIANSTGTVAERYAYSAYGVPAFLTPIFSGELASAYAWESLFGGYRYDTATELILVRNRLYHSALGSWLQRDPLRYVDGMNLYEYAASNPLRYTDPTGTDSSQLDKDLKQCEIELAWNMSQAGTEYHLCLDAAKTKYQKALCVLGFDFETAVFLANYEVCKQAAFDRMIARGGATFCVWIFVPPPGWPCPGCRPRRRSWGR